MFLTQCATFLDAWVMGQIIKVKPLTPQLRFFVDKPCFVRPPAKREQKIVHHVLLLKVKKEAVQ
jgi:hypothetical protein